MYFYDSEMGQGLLSHQMKKVCGVYVDSWKNFKYPYFLVFPQSTEAHSSFCVLPVDNLSLSSPLLLSWPNVGINSKKVEPGPLLPGSEPIFISSRSSDLKIGDVDEGPGHL